MRFIIHVSQKCKCIELKQSTSFCVLTGQPFTRGSRHFRGESSGEVCFKHLKFRFSKSLLFFRNFLFCNLQHFYLTFFHLYLKRLRHSYNVVILHCPTQSLAPRLNISYLFPFVLLFPFQSYFYPPSVFFNTCKAT